MSDKKNCLSCEFLEWVDDDSIVSENSGFTCNKRVTGDESPAWESYVLKQLESPKYRRRYKRCYEPVTQ